MERRTAKLFGKTFFWTSRFPHKIERFSGNQKTKVENRNDFIRLFRHSAERLEIAMSHSKGLGQTGRKAHAPAREIT